jgi:hypothetical protein
MRALRIRFILALAIVLGACATTAPPGTTVPSRSGDVVSAGELATVSQLNLLEALRRLRPTWLRVRSRSTPPVVFIDGIRRGGAEVLRDFRASEAIEIRRRSGTDATTLYGTGVGGGTIEVRTRR